MGKFPNQGGSKLVKEFVDKLLKGNKKLHFTENPYTKVGGKTTLKKDAVYVAGKPGKSTRYVYTTDSKGRVKSAHARPLELPKGNTRGRHSRNTPGKREGDHAGHLFADQFGGSGKIDNLVSQSSDVNLKKMAALERDWKQRIANGEKIDVNIEVKYSPDGTRPTGFDVFEYINGRKVTVGQFQN